jgi:hypothetical protein
MNATALALDSYRLLGRSGLRVSPLALGPMTFGSDWGWAPTVTDSPVFTPNGGWHLNACAAVRRRRRPGGWRGRA